MARAILHRCDDELRKRVLHDEGLRLALQALQALQAFCVRIISRSKALKDWSAPYRSASKREHMLNIEESLEAEAA